MASIRGSRIKERKNYVHKKDRLYRCWNCWTWLRSRRGSVAVAAGFPFFDAVWLPHDVSKGTLHSVYDTGRSVAVPYPVFLFCSENDPVRKGAIK